MANSLFDLSNINGSNGFRIQGIDLYGQFGTSVSNAGDVNGDGIDDLVIGAPNAGERTIIGNYNQYTTSGESYIVFGGSGIGSDGGIDLSSLDNSNGFVLEGNDGDRFGTSVSNAGDVNGDSIEDLVIGAPGTYNYSNDTGGEGKSYLVFGGAELGSDSSNGFIVNGIAPGDRSGYSVGNAGDVNSDGIDDIVIGAPNAAGELLYDSFYGYSANNGESYVVFGGSEISNNGSLELSSLDGSNGFIIEGIDDGFLNDGEDEFLSGYDQEERFGFTVDGGSDLNGDGFEDIVIGAPGRFDGEDRAGGSGETYVIFGGSGIGSNGSVDLDSLDGNNGFVLDYTSSNEFFGVSVNSSGDINGDGFDDLSIYWRGLQFLSKRRLFSWYGIRICNIWQRRSWR